MRPTYRLTATAHETLAEISQWTIEMFGQRQQELYLDLVLARFSAIANGHAASRSASEFTGRPSDENIRCTTAGQHIILYLQRDGVTEIIDLFHSRSNLKTRISNTLDQDGET